MVQLKDPVSLEIPSKQDNPKADKKDKMGMKTAFAIAVLSVFAFIMCGLVSAVTVSTPYRFMGLAAVIWAASGVGLIFRLKWGRFLFMIVAALFALLVLVDILFLSGLGGVQRMAAQISPEAPQFALIMLFIARAVLVGCYISGILLLRTSKARAQFS